MQRTIWIFSGEGYSRLFTFQTWRHPWFSYHPYNTVCVEKDEATILLSVTSPKVDWFSKFFQLQTQYFAIKSSLNIPPHLKCVTTLPCEMLVLRSVWPTVVTHWILISWLKFTSRAQDEKICDIMKAFCSCYELISVLIRWQLFSVAGWSFNREQIVVCQCWCLTVWRPCCNRLAVQYVPHRLLTVPQ